MTMVRQAHHERGTWPCLSPRAAGAEPADGLAVAPLSALRVRGSWYAREVHRAPFDRLRVSGTSSPLMVNLSNHAADGGVAAVVAGAAGCAAHGGCRCRPPPPPRRAAV